MGDDSKHQPTATRNPARQEGVDPSAGLAPPTPDSIASDDNVGRRAAIVNGAVVGAGAGAGGGGGVEDFDSDAQGGGEPMPKPVENDAPERGGDGRNHGSH